MSQISTRVRYFLAKRELERDRTPVSVQSKRLPESKTLGLILTLHIVNAGAMVGLYYLTHSLALALFQVGVTVALFFADIVRDWVRKPYRKWVLGRQGVPDACRVRLGDIEDYRTHRVLTEKNPHIVCAATVAAGNDAVGVAYGNRFMQYADRFTHLEAHELFDALAKPSVYTVGREVAAMDRYMRAWDASGRPSGDAIALLRALGLSRATEVVSTDLPVEYATALA